MLRRTVLLLFLIYLLPACVSRLEQDQQNAPVTTLQIVDPLEDSTDSPSELKIYIWSLGGNGWAVEIGHRFLIFDCVQTIDPDLPVGEASEYLQSGYIHPGEIADYEVYVFVTHSHEDHYDPSILVWEESIADITYIFGWEAGDNPDHHYLIGPRAQGEFGSLKVYTINSHHAGVPEVAFLVDVEGIMFYHNGDYMASYIEDFNYLSGISDRMDIAFVIGWPYEDHQQFQQALLLDDLFSPKYMFAICREGDEIRCQQFADLLGEYGVSAQVEYAEKRGELFVLNDYSGQ